MFSPKFEEKWPEILQIYPAIADQQPLFQTLAIQQLSNICLILTLP